jgi:hypothetical protein
MWRPAVLIELVWRPGQRGRSGPRVPHTSLRHRITQAHPVTRSPSGVRCSLKACPRLSSRPAVALLHWPRQRAAQTRDRLALQYVCQSTSLHIVKFVCQSVGRLVATLRSALSRSEDSVNRQFSVEILLCWCGRGLPWFRRADCNTYCCRFCHLCTLLVQQWMPMFAARPSRSRHGWSSGRPVSSEPVAAAASSHVTFSTQ